MATKTFTCIGCRVIFPDADMQREHYKTDWHRYNLKRKVAELPAVTAEAFKEKVLSYRAVAEAEALASEKHPSYCDICRKHFSTDNSYRNHLRSRKHRDELKGRIVHEEESISALNQSNVEEITQHLLTDNVHEQSTDSIPTTETATAQDQSSQTTVDQGRSTDPAEDGGDEGEWEDYEGLEVTECLFCSQQSGDVEANLDHMSIKHSFFLPDVEYISDLKGLIKYLGVKVGVDYLCLFCNERGKTFHSVEAVQKHMLDKGHARIFFEGDAPLEYADFYDYRSSYPDDKEGDDELPDMSISINSNLELVLPSGGTVGHRTFKHYYRQNIPSSNSQALVSRNTSSINKIMAKYRAIGYHGNSVEEIHKRKIKGEAFCSRMRKHKELGLGLKTNKLQHHFRAQNPI